MARHLILGPSVNAGVHVARDSNSDEWQRLPRHPEFQREQRRYRRWVVCKDVSVESARERTHRVGEGGRAISLRMSMHDRRTMLKRQQAGLTVPKSDRPTQFVDGYSKLKSAFDANKDPGQVVEPCLFPGGITSLQTRKRSRHPTPCFLSGYKTGRLQGDKRLTCLPAFPRHTYHSDPLPDLHLTVRNSRRTDGSQLLRRHHYCSDHPPFDVLVIGFLAASLRHF